MSNEIKEISLSELKSNLAHYFKEMAEGKKFHVTYEPQNEDKRTFLLQSFDQEASASNTENTFSDTTGFDPNLAVRLDSLPIKPATMNKLFNRGIVFVGDLVQMSKVDILRDYCHEKSDLDELYEKVFKHFKFDYETDTKDYLNQRPDTTKEPSQFFTKRSEMILYSKADKITVKDGRSGKSLAVFTPV